jgi:hypothetical protein
LHADFVASFGSSVPQKGDGTFRQIKHHGDVRGAAREVGKVVGYLSLSNLPVVLLTK